MNIYPAFERIKDMNNIECTLCSIKWNNYPFPEDAIIHAWAMITEHNTFVLGLQGCFEIVDEEIDISSGQICPTCLQGITFRECTVACDRCHHTFPQCMPDTNQGDRCASSVTETYIVGCYGSREYDYLKVPFRNKRPHEILCGWNLCDDCITALIENDICESPY